jgi:ferredoxin, 2Fe-2S
MVDIHVRERDGTERVVSTRLGGSLMEALRDADTGVEGICGGNCSCGTCHVYVAEDWAGLLAPPSIDETDMLDAVGDVVERRQTSRLGCQIPLTEAIDGIALEIAPEA